MNDLPYYSGTGYATLDGQVYDDYDAAYDINAGLVSNYFSAYYNPASALYNEDFDLKYQVPATETVEQTLSQGTVPAGNGNKGGWSWLTPVFGGIVDAGSGLLQLKIQEKLQTENIAAQGRIALAQQQQALQLLAQSNKVSATAPAPAPAWAAPAAVGVAILAVLMIVKGARS